MSSVTDHIRDNPEALYGILKHPSLASHLKKGAPVFLMVQAAVPWANAAALALFGGRDPADLARRVFDSTEPAMQRFASDIAAIDARMPSRLQRLRFTLDGRPETATLLLQGHPLPSGRHCVAAVAVQMRPGLLPTAPAEAATPKSVRFLWHSDARGIVTFVSPELATATGARDVVDYALSDLVESRDGALAAALASRASFRGLEADWPLVAGEGIIPVTLGGLPHMMADGSFAGFKGFGILHCDRIKPSREPAMPEDSDEPKEEAPPGQAARLSSNERDAFDEIARALGGRIEEEPGAQEPPLAPSAETRARAAADQSFSRNAQALLNRLPIGILVSRGDVPIFLNRTLLDLLGYDNIDAFYAQDGMEHMFQGHRAGQHGSLESGSIALMARDGEIIPVDGRMQTIDWDGMPASLMSFRRSLQAEFAPRVENFEAQLRARDAELRELHAILDTATDGVAVLDDAGRILSLNRAAEALFGRDGQDVSGLPFTVLLAPESHLAARDYLQSLKSGGVASVMNDGREVVGQERQGGTIPLFMTLGRIGSSEIKFCAVLRDMTQWKKAERELHEAKKLAEKANAQKSDFLAKISHEIRTPLNAILGFAEVMMEEQFGPIGNTRYKDYMRDIHASGTHVMSLVNDLLDLSKIEAGKLELHFSGVDTNRVVSECVSLMQPQANQARVIIRLSLGQRIPNILADERSIRQIVLNLLSNAVKFNEPGGQVIISTALTDAGHTVIRVRDTGIGMSESEIEMAMEPFRQLDTSRKVPGTGLGLPLTRALVEANHARFSIRSKKQEGTLIEITFPPVRVLAE